MKDEHMGEAIELYALGALGRDEAREVEDHAAVCADCSRLLGEAERTVFALDELTVPQLEAPPELGARIAASSRVVVPLRSRRPNVALWAALAAGLLVAGFGATVTHEIRNDRATIAADDLAFSSIAVSHFLHTTFTKRSPDAPTAKVLWGKTPHWFYVIVDSASCDCNVVEITSSGERDLGPPAPRGNTATIFVPDAPDAKGLELRTGTRVLASVQRPMSP
jgi:hypothetical protein